MSTPEDVEETLPPSSPQAELGILGCVLLSPTDSMLACIEQISNPEAFYTLTHRLVYQAILALFEAGTPIDAITIGEKLKDLGQLEQVGGYAFLGELPDHTPSALNIGHYIDIVRQKHGVRKLIAACTKGAAQAYEVTGSIEPVLEVVDSELRAIAESTSNTSTLKTAKELVVIVTTTVEQAMVHKNQIQGIPTGFYDFDKRSGGLLNGEMIVVAGRPGSGKSALSMNIAVNVAKENIAVVFFSLEMTAESLMLRALCSESKVAMNNVRSGTVTDAELGQLAEAALVLSQTSLYIDDASGLSVLQLRARARRVKQMYGIKLVITDYLQLLHSTRRRGANRQEEVADISYNIKVMAKELDVPVIAVSQLNRDVEKRTNKKPTLADLRESGAVEQDADVVALLYAKENGNGDNPALVKTGLITAKSRNGPTGEDELLFIKPYTRFESSTKIPYD